MKDLLNEILEERKLKQVDEGKMSSSDKKKAAQMGMKAVKGFVNKFEAFLDDYMMEELFPELAKLPDDLELVLLTSARKAFIKEFTKQIKNLY